LEDGRSLGTDVAGTPKSTLKMTTFSIHRDISKILW